MNVISAQKIKRHTVNINIVNTVDGRSIINMMMSVKSCNYFFLFGLPI